MRGIGFKVSLLLFLWMGPGQRTSFSRRLDSTGISLNIWHVFPAARV